MKIVSMSRTHTDFVFKTITQENDDIYYESKNFSFTRFVNSGAYIYMIAEIEFFELYKFDCCKREFIERAIFFKITPPYDIWRFIYYSYKEAEYSQAIKDREEKGKLSFGNYILRVIKKELIDSPNNKNINELVTIPAYYIECKSSDNSLNMKRNEYIEDAKAFIDDFLTIVSIISGHSISWYKYEYISLNEIIDGVITTNFEFNKKIVFNDLLIEDRDLKKFICLALPKYYELKEKNIDLKRPIRSYLFNEKAEFLEQQFIITYVALESICNQLSIFYNFDTCVEEKIFKEKIRDYLKDHIKSLNLDDIEKENIFKKIPELNRSSVSYKFEKIFEKYEIDISDCYDSHNNIKFLGVRNQLIHSLKHNSDDLLHTEYYRVKRYFELLILKLLGWEKGVSSYNKFHNRFSL